jgi:hypothetical protein
MIPEVRGRCLDNKGLGQIHPLNILQNKSSKIQVDAKNIYREKQNSYLTSTHLI